MRRSVALGWLLLALAAGCGGMPHAATHPASVPTSGPPLSISTSSEARAAVKDARLTRTLLLDGGKLRLDPTSDTLRLSEDRAVHLWAAGEPVPGGVVVSKQAVLLLARVSLRIPVSTAGLLVRPATVPSFADRVAWVMLWQNGPHSCPRLPVHPTGPGGLEPQPVEIIAADGSDAGVSYKTRGSFCDEPPAGPTATPAVYQESLPWTIASRTAGGVTISFTIPACGAQSGLTGPGGTAETVFVGAAVALGAGPCPGAKPGPATATIGLRPGTAPTHGATGLLVGRVSGDLDHLTYFDGKNRSLPVNVW